MAGDKSGALHLLWSNIRTIDVENLVDGRELFYQKRDPQTGWWTFPVMISKPAQFVSPTAFLEAGMYEIATSFTQSLIGYTEQILSTDYVPQLLGEELVLFQNTLGAETYTQPVHVTNAAGVGSIISEATGAFYLSVYDNNRQTYLMTVSPSGQRSMELVNFIFSFMAINPEGIHASWHEGGPLRTDPTKIYYALSQGGTWSPPEKIYESAQSSSVVAMAANDTRVIAVVADNSDATTGGAYDLIYFIKEKGVWTQERLTNTSNDSEWVSMGIDTTGRIHIAWTELGSDSDVYYSWYPK